MKLTLTFVEDDSQISIKAFPGKNSYLYLDNPSQKINELVYYHKVKFL